MNQVDKRMNRQVYPIEVNKCMIKFNNRNTRKKCEIFSKITIKSQELGT